MIGMITKKNVSFGLWPNSSPTVMPIAIALSVPTSSGTNIRMKPCTRTRCGMPRIEPATRQAMKKYWKLAVRNVVAIAFSAGSGIRP